MMRRYGPAILVVVAAALVLVARDVRALLSAPLGITQPQVVDVPRGTTMNGLLRVFEEHGVLASKGEGRRLLAQGGLYVNDVPAEEGRVLEASDWRFDRWCMVRRGKKQRHLLVKQA